MKKIFYILLFFPLLLFSQQEMVFVAHPVYSFLERMSVLKIIEEYNHFEKPIARVRISSYLKEIHSRKENLSEIDQKMLEDFMLEFEYELTGKLENSQSLILADSYSLLNEKEKYLYSYYDDENNSLFINLIAEATTTADVENKRSSINGNLGGKLRGTFANFFSFALNATNGYEFQDKSTAKIFNLELRNSFKFNSYPPSNFFDDAYGHISLVRNNFNLKLGNDAHTIGYGILAPFLQNSSLRVPLLSAGFNVGIFNFSYLHGILYGEESTKYDSVQGVIKNVKDKYFAYHRFSFDLSDDFNFGVGEIIVYGDRNIDFSYLNPFNFYKSAEHANGDRDNSMLFFDFQSKHLKNNLLFGTILIDDVDFAKLGTNWWGNQFLYHFGLHSYYLYATFPLIIKAEYLRIDPYVFTHRIRNNYFAGVSLPLGIEFQPNSESYNLGLEFYFNNRLKSELNFLYQKHGANIWNASGTDSINVGGNRHSGHREFDSKESTFLDGNLEITRQIDFIIIYEPYNNIFINFILKNIFETKVNTSTSKLYFHSSIKLLF